MNGNEILRHFDRNGFNEKTVKEMFLRIAEEQRDIKAQINEMAKAFEALVRVQTMLNGVADGLKTQMDLIQNKGDNDPSSTRGMLG